MPASVFRSFESGVAVASSAAGAQARSAQRRAAGGVAGDDEDGVVAGDGADDVGQADRSSALARNCAAPGGVRSTAMLPLRPRW